MHWKAYYKEKLTTANEAVKLIKSGDRVVTGLGVGGAPALLDAMVNNHEAYRDVEIVSMLPLVKPEYMSPDMEPHFRHNSLFISANSRQTVSDGHGDYTPCYFYRIPLLWDEDLPVDVAIIHVSPPDEHGYCSLGVSVDYTKHAAESAKILIAQVNTYMPRTLGDSFVHVSQMHCIVEQNEPLLSPGAPTIGAIEKAIGEHCASLVNDGDCLQLGIGAIPDAVLLFLKERKDLGVHTEMFSDGVLELVKAGVINNSKKNFNPGKIIATFLIGSQAFYEFVDNNPMVSMHPVTYTNDPFIAGQNDNLVSINSCVQVDLLGQVSSETVGMTQISGVGGQVDFVRAAAMSKGGRSIIAMPSTAKGGTVSKIVPLLDEGAVVTTNRCDVQYIVTEYGIANLKNRTNKERARALIEIAHPNFRDALKAVFENRFNCKY
ncbi:MAG: 4-hydroxybutyrate CoA-transferase [Oscillospiraceae bacterium]|nr:4-hydroxybutyrate CoA-transferase [Oscillospiraceae bacterium]